MDAVTKGWDFYGNVVNMGARVEAAGHGGQILITGDAYNALLGGEMSHDSKKCFSSEDPTLPEGMKRELGILNVKHHGEIQLRGLSSPTPLLEIVPDQISPRAFPPLRVDLNVRMESEDIGADLVHASPEEQLDGSIRLSMKAAGVSNYDDALMSDVRGLQCNIKCLLSLFKEKEKHDLLEDLLHRWHLTVPQVDKRLLEVVGREQFMILVLSVRVATVSEATKMPYNKLKGINLREMRSTVPYIRQSLLHFESRDDLPLAEGPER